MAVAIFGGVIEAWAGIPMKSYLSISFLDFCAVAKALSNIDKFSAQVLKNYNQKAVFGVNMASYFIDFVGSGAGILQMQVDAVINGHSHILVDPHFNLAKLLLNAIAMTFEAIIICQRYFVYPS